MKKILAAAMTTALMVMLPACSGVKTALDEVPLSDKPDTTAPTDSQIEILSNNDFKPITATTDVTLPYPFVEESVAHLRVRATDPQGLGTVELKIIYDYQNFDGTHKVEDATQPWPKCENVDHHELTDRVYLLPKDLVVFRFEIKPRDDGTGKLVVATTLADPFNVVDVPLPRCYKEDDLRHCSPDYKEECLPWDRMMPDYLTMTLQLVVTNRSGLLTRSEKLVLQAPNVHY